MTEDEDLLLQCDSILSLILHRNPSQISELNRQDIETLLPRLRKRTDEISKRNRPGTEEDVPAYDLSTATIYSVQSYRLNPYSEHGNLYPEHTEFHLCRVCGALVSVVEAQRHRNWHDMLEMMRRGIRHR